MSRAAGPIMIGPGLAIMIASHHDLFVPPFCRHNRLVQNCPICSREQHVEMRPVITPAVPGASAPAHTPRERSPRATPGSRGAMTSGVRVHRLARSADDGYRSPLAPGLRSSADALRLAEELAFAAGRLVQLETAPPGLYDDVAREGDIEERAWLAFQIAYLCPLEGEQPFAAIQAVRTSWASGEQPELEGVRTGPRTAHDPERGTRTLEAYRAWAGRAGSQAQAFRGEPAWGAERRFARAFERLALPGLHRDARFDLLVTLGALGVFELQAGTLALGGARSTAGDTDVVVAAKRALGIGDPLLLERRAAELAGACEVPLAALDLGFFNWARPPARPPERDGRVTLGLDSSSDPEPAALEKARRALGL